MVDMVKERTLSATQWDRNQLEAQEDDKLMQILAALELRLGKIEKEQDRNRLFQSVMKKRSGRILLDSMSAFRLSRRLERLFEVVRTGENDPWPVQEVLGVFDGLVARMLAKRITLFVVALFAVVPAVSSLILLAEQNRHMIEQNRVEESYDLERIRKSLLEVINGTSAQFVVDENGVQSLELLSTYHKRIREEAFGTYISIDKQRWSKEQVEAEPPLRFVDLRGCNLNNLALGGALGLVEGESRDDISRVFLGNGNLQGTKFLRSKLTGSVFKNANAQGMLVSSPDARYCDFSGIDAKNATFSWDAKTSTPIDLSHASFDRAQLEDSFFDQAILINTSFTGTNLSNVSVYAGMVAECDFTQADFGAGIRFPETPVHKTLIRIEQKEKIELESFCFFEKTEDHEILRIMTDKKKYDAWWAGTKATLDAAAETELEEVKTKNRELKAAGEI